ncbi:MAG: hypothetical protein GTO14_02405 [Anaerolineales bacterium]|nr:hypothetical protein [Anaerolineales bacterium]
MEIGMLWFDDSKVSLQEKIKRAVLFYTEKYGREPTLCLVNPNTLNGGERSMSGVEVRKASCVMPDHFWIGVDDKSRPTRRSRRKAA